jgi:hypothetical protein
VTGLKKNDQNDRKTSENQRKLQVSNGHYLDFDQLARLMIVIQQSESTSLSLNQLVEETGLPLRQVRNRISIGRAIGVIQKTTFRLTNFGNLVKTYDPFFDFENTLVIVHYLAASNYTNLVWYELFNTVLDGQNALDYEDVMKHFRRTLAGLYSEYSLNDHVSKEVRFLIDAYTEQNLRKLELLRIDSEDKIQRGRYTNFDPSLCAALIYRYCEIQGSRVCELDSIVTERGSPARVFGVDRSGFQRYAEALHTKGWLRYETTHSLDQIRLIPGYTFTEFLTSSFEQREPVKNG